MSSKTKLAESQKLWDNKKFTFLVMRVAVFVSSDNGFFLM